MCVFVVYGMVWFGVCGVCVRVCVTLCARVLRCVRAYVRACVYVYVYVYVCLWYMVWCGLCHARTTGALLAARAQLREIQTPEVE